MYINRTFVARDIEVGMEKGRYRQIAGFDFEGYNFHDIPYFIYFSLVFHKFMDVSFLMSIESLHFDI